MNFRTINDINIELTKKQIPVETLFDMASWSKNNNYFKEAIRCYYKALQNLNEIPQLCMVYNEIGILYASK